MKFFDGAINICRCLSAGVGVHGLLGRWQCNGPLHWRGVAGQCSLVCAMDGAYQFGE
jgi:hypothetical protein